LDNIDIKIKGSMVMTLAKPNGDIEVRRKDNIIVNGGFDFICDALANASRPAAMGQIAVGTGSSTPVATQTTLGTELLRKSATYAHKAGTKIFTLTTTFNEGEASGAIVEAGVFNSASGGVMLDRVTFSVINKGADDVLTCQFQFTLS
jgi:hypothetical protein